MILWSDREWSKKLGGASYDILFDIIDRLLASGVSLILESNFSAERHSASATAFLKKYGAEAVQILCHAPGPVLVERFRTRPRHPGHVDQNSIDEHIPTLMKGTAESLQIPGELVRVNTIDFETMNYPALVAQMRQFLQK